MTNENETKTERKIFGKVKELSAFGTLYANKRKKLIDIEFRIRDTGCSYLKELVLCGDLISIGHIYIRRGGNHLEINPQELLNAIKRVIAKGNVQTKEVYVMDMNKGR